MGLIISQEYASHAMQGTNTWLIIYHQVKVIVRSALLYCEWQVFKNLVHFHAERSTAESESSKYYGRLGQGMIFAVCCATCWQGPRFFE